MTIDLTNKEIKLLNKLLLKSEQYALTAYPIELDLTPSEQEAVKSLLKKTGERCEQSGR